MRSGMLLPAGLALLTLLAACSTDRRQREGREVALRRGLRVLRDVIDQHYGDQRRYPASLQALVEEGYLRAIPVDPITERNDTWVVIEEEPQPGRPAGIIDVRSGSEKLARDGTPYSEW